MQINNTVALANQTLKDNLLAYMNKYKMLTDWLEIEDGKIRSVNFSGSIKISEGFNANSILQKISDELKKFMNVDTRDMGEALRISDVYAVIDNIEGIIFVELDSPAQTITPANNELLILGDMQWDVLAT